MHQGDGMQTWSSPIGAKFQITLPKKVRQALGIRSPGELVGFLVDGTRVVLTKAAIVAQGETFTEEEWAKLTRLADAPVPRSYDAKTYLYRLLRRL